MPKIKLMGDSACDITFEQEKEGDIEVMNFKVAMGDNSYTTRVDFDNKKFYKMLEEFGGLPSTSQVTAFEFEEAYEKYFREGYEGVIYVSINKNGSGTYNNAIMAKNTFFENHPDADGKFKIAVIDSHSYTCAYGYPLVCAADMVKHGESFERIVEYITDWVDNAVIFFAMYTLKYAKKSGRIPSAAAFVGEMLGLRPVMKIADGEIITHDKVRGDKNVIPTLIRHTLGSMEPGTPYCCIYGSDGEVQGELVEECTKAIGYPPAFTTEIGAAVAINSGPAVAGIMFRKKQ